MTFEKKAQFHFKSELSKKKIPNLRKEEIISILKRAFQKFETLFL